MNIISCEQLLSKNLFLLTYTCTFSSYFYSHEKKKSSVYIANFTKHAGNSQAFYSSARNKTLGKLEDDNRLRAPKEVILYTYSRVQWGKKWLFKCEYTFEKFWKLREVEDPNN